MSIKDFQWFHTIEIEPGVFTPGVKGAAILAKEYAAFGLPEDLSGKSVLDVGCSNGYFSFECKKRGASRVLGVDTWDKRLTSNGIYVHSEECFEFARKALGLNVDGKKKSVYDLSAQDDGTFDPADHSPQAARLQP